MRPRKYVELHCRFLGLVRLSETQTRVRVRPASSSSSSSNRRKSFDVARARRGHYNFDDYEDVRDRWVQHTVEN